MEDNISKEGQRKLRKILTECKVCGAPARYSYFGVVVCSTCKVFFKYNAEKGQDHFKCVFQKQCEVNVYNRHVCTFCRLAKCLASGMQVKMIRPSRTTMKKNLQPEKLSTLNLLRSDQSTLSTEQWSLLSNLVHCYDEHSGFSLAHRFVQQQNQLPPKMRFKFASIGEFLASIFSPVQDLYEKNADFISLCSHDRSILLHNTIKFVGGLSSHFITRHIPVLEDPALYTSFETIYGSKTLAIGNHAANQLDSDNTFVKLALALLTFSIFQYTYYTNKPSETLRNIQAISCIQDRYIELIWRYLIYKYGHERAVICFSNLIRCIFLINNGLIQVQEHQQYTSIIDSIVKQTEKTLTLAE